MKLATIINTIIGLFVIGASITTVLVNVAQLKKNKAEKKALSNLKY
jgi:hypothetical protein